MERRLPDQLLPWIAGSLLLLIVIFAVAVQVPSVDCGGENADQDGPEAVLLAITVVAIVIAVAAAVLRLVLMGRYDCFGRRDGWILGLAVFVLGAATLYGGTIEESAAAGLAVGGFLLAGIAFVALLGAVLLRLDVDDVGVLLPIYLFGAAWVYLAVATVVLLAKSGIGC
jgi:hypothetical protein